MGDPGEEWSFGDVEAGLAEADLVLDETIVQPSTSHQPLETRTAMAYWENGKCFLFASTQSTVRSHAPAANWIGIDPEDLVFIAEYCGGGFGSKIPGSIFEAIPALLSRKTRQAGHDGESPATRSSTSGVCAQVGRDARRSGSATTAGLRRSTCTSFRATVRTAGRVTF